MQPKGAQRGQRTPGTAPRKAYVRSPLPGGVVTQPRRLRVVVRTESWPPGVPPQQPYPESALLAPVTGSDPKKALRRKVKESPVKGQVTLEGDPLDTLSLNDKIPDKCHTLFVGVNPGIRSATIGHYFAGHSNYFWKLLYASGIWPSPLKTDDDDQIVLKGFGLTDVAKRPTPGIAGLRKNDYSASRERIRAIAGRYQPYTIVFVSKQAVRAFRGDPKYVVKYGLQTWKIEESDVFVVPSTSGASLADTSYGEKLKVFEALREHISSYYSFQPKARER